MEMFTYILTAILAATLIAAGIFLCFRARPATAPTIGSVLTIGFLVLLLLHTSKFKHVQGFGFDAETWDEKQVEAAKLVDQLSVISEGLSQQVALLASRVGGFWGSGLTNPELAALLRQTDAQLQVTKTISQSRRDEILAPIRLRISTNYWTAARNLIDKAYIAKSSEIAPQPNHNEKFQVFNEEVKALDTIPVPHIPSDLNVLLEAFRSSKILVPQPQAVLAQLEELDEDLRFFNASKENRLRREIDLEALYASPHAVLMAQ